MADEANAQAAEESAATVENPTADSASDNQTGEQTSQTTETQSDSSDKQEGKSEQSESSDAGSSDKDQSKTQDSKESKPLSRRSAAFRIQQLVEENKTLKKQLGQSDKQDDWEEETRADDKLDVAALVAQEVQKALNPVVTASSKAADDAELSELFSGNNAADRSKYEGQIRSLWNLSQYKDVAAVDLLNMLRGKEMDQHLSQARQQAVEDYKKAEKDAKESSASGTSNTNRSGKSGKSVADMTPQELEEHNQRVIAGRA